MTARPVQRPTARPSLPGGQGDARNEGAYDSVPLVLPHLPGLFVYSGGCSSLLLALLG